MMHDLSTEKTIGIIGGGQLALMMAEKAHKLGIKVRVYSKTADCPARLAGAEVKTDMREFFKGLHVVTIENEFLSLDEVMAAAQGMHVHIFPTLDVIELTQNKLNQKLIFQKLNMPTADFVYFDPQLDDLSKWISELPIPCMIKWAMGGYDGRGNFALKSENQLAEARAFCEQAMKNYSLVYAENIVDFKRELAMVYVRNMPGDFIHYPLVISEQENNVCKTVTGPATALFDATKLEQQAVELGREIADALGFVGAFALEFFETQDGELLINEMAPRVHNSGHYTQDVYKGDQFENHIRAVLGLKLVEDKPKSVFIMRNLLGPKELSATLPNEDLGKSCPLPVGIHAHWYGKTELKPGRKMGHLNLVFTDKDQVQSKLASLVDAENKFWQYIREKKSGSKETHKT